jgi:hypothetical protein
MVGWTKAGVALAVAGLVGFGLVETGTLRLPEVGSVTKFLRPAPQPLTLPRIELKSLSSEYGFLQGSFVISNTEAFPIANTSIHCDVHGPGGAVIHGFDFVVDELVPANGKKPINNYKFGFWPQESSQMDCRTISVERR